MTLHLRWAARSHAGLLRPLNEDSVYAGPRVLAVADGMGGHAAGEVASAVAIAAVAQLDEDVPGADLLGDLQASARSANAHLRDMVAGDPTLAGMGTTLVALLFDRNRLGLLHIGDSRCYLLRDGELTQITHDHTLVQALVDEGRLTEEAASTHPQRSVITKVLDGRDDLEPDLSVREARDGDRYLVCSDGLTGPVGSLETLREALQIPDLQLACDRLVELALRGGGPDNVTVIVADVVDDDEVRHADPVIAGAAAEGPQEIPAGLAHLSASRAQVAEGRTPPPRTRTPEEPAGPRTRRTALSLLTLMVLLTVGATATALYVRSQFYVGLDAGHVAIFRGVRGSVAGLDLAKVEERSTLAATRLSPVEQQHLEDGIVARGERDARTIVQRLIDDVCASPSPPVTGLLPTAIPTSLPTAGPSPATSPAPAPGTTPTPTPAPSPCP
jgi:protein phosphatase